ncbi:MAG: hypothetical protein SV760_05660, partial [Halobacteria archaeon]|nr:hypothetical protein [Halobacteria archaeon]
KSSNPQAYLLPPLPENANPAGTVVGLFNRAFLDTASNPEIGETISGKRRDLSPTAIEKGVFVDEYEVENLTSFYRGGARVLVGDLASETVDENSSGIGLSIG